MTCIRERRIRWGGILVASIVAAGPPGVALAQVQVSGNVDPDVIQIDTSANLFFVSGAPSLNPVTPTIDWVNSTTGTTDTNCLVLSQTGNCYQAGVSAAPGGQGIWNGFRVVDGVAGGDEDIFLTGGKEDDTSTWNPGPGTVGSSKFDATEMYVANNDNTLFFGMERRGNNGTTAFDFEFNQNPPDLNDPRNVPIAYIPTRTVGDILFSFEMTGSGSSGSATAHIFIWNGTSYGEITDPNDLAALHAAGLVTSINQDAVAAGPWGYVDSKGDWVLGSLPRFSFAEAAVPTDTGIFTLPLSSGCTRSAFVQIRTRSSVSSTSDLKDTTPIFEYVFSGPTLSAAKTGSDALASTVSLGGTLTGGGSGTTFQWQIFNRTTQQWVAITNATSSTLTFPAPAAGTFTFEASDFASTDLDAGNPFQVVLDGSTFFSKIRSVDIRLHVQTTLGGQSCQLDSNEVTVRKLVGVDP
jgi:hypothetical protein